MIAACIQVAEPASHPSPYGPPVAAFSPGDLIIPPYTPISFYDESTDSPTSWTWTINGATFSISQNPNYFFAYSGDYTIRLTVQNAYGSDYVEHTITVTSGGAIP